MGRKIIIKDADFSANACGEEIIKKTYKWYIDECPLDVSNALPANVVNGGWAYYDTNNNKLRGKKINCIKFIPATVGILPFYKSSSLSSQGEQIAEINIIEGQLQKPTIYQFSDVLIADDEYLIVGKAQSVGSFYFLTSGEGFYAIIPISPTRRDNVALGLSVGYYGY